MSEKVHYLIKEETLQEIAQAVRNKTNETGEIVVSELANKINNIKGGGGSSPSNPSASLNEVNFYDYDGTLLYSYTVEEAQALTELPPLPTQPGLICQEWNYDLDTIKSYNRPVNVGATYITDDGKTRLYIRIAAEGRMNVPIYFRQTVSNGVTIDWGDGSATEKVSGTGGKTLTHVYRNIGDYVISLDVANGCFLELGLGSNDHSIMGFVGSIYCNMLQKVEIGRGVTNIGTEAFSFCTSLTNVVIPNGVTCIDFWTFIACPSLMNIIIPNSVTIICDEAFAECSALVNVVIPNSVTEIQGAAFRACPSLASIVLPNSVTNINFSLFLNCHSLTSVVIPNSITTIGASTFNNCNNMAIYDFMSYTFVPTLSSTNAFKNIPSDCIIKVPASLYDEWITATNWSTYASQIVAV